MTKSKESCIWTIESPTPEGAFLVETSCGRRIEGSPATTPACPECGKNILVTTRHERKKHEKKAGPPGKTKRPRQEP
jgi:predicted RNA-binding Zn-ribbon protein involved in translation (DUF1610 family)